MLLEPVLTVTAAAAIILTDITAKNTAITAKGTFIGIVYGSIAGYYGGKTYGYGKYGDYGYGYNGYGYSGGKRVTENVTDKREETAEDEQ